MIEINAVNSDKINLSGSADVPALTDHSYVPPYKNEAVGAETATMSFDDFLDMINPLEHIPIISSIYRGITGDTINPVARIVGDTLYSGPLGLLSAGLTAAGAIGDEVIAANNGGQSASSAVVATLFGGPDEQVIKLAAGTTIPRVDSVAGDSLQSSNVGAAPPIPGVVPPPTPALPTLVANSSSGMGLPLDRSKLPYGGVMDSSMVQSAQQNQTLAMAMAGQNGIMQAQRALRSNRFVTAKTPTPEASNQTSSVNNPLPAVTPPPNSPQTQAALQALIQELQATKAINQYKNSAQITPIPGVTVDTAN